MSRILSTATILISLFVLLNSQAVRQESRRGLGLYFSNLSPSAVSLNPVLVEFARRIGRALEVPSENVIFGSLQPDILHPGGSVFPFKLTGAQLVTDSVSTSEAYYAFSAKWKNALANGDSNGLILPLFNFNGKDLAIDDNHFEFDLGDDVEEGLDPQINSSTKRKDMITAMHSRYEVMQLRLRNSNLKDFAQSSKLNHLVGGLRTVAAAVLGVQEDRIIMFAINEGSIVAQFTAHPATASDLDYSSKKWSAAIANKDTAISRVFDDVDFSYPAVKRTGVTTTSTPSNKRDAKETGSSAGLVAGAVLGSLAAVALVGGCVAGYMYRKQKRNTAAQVNQKRGQDFGEVSPGGNIMSPNGLANVNVHGEATPNPHNFRH